jgi:hypothetical protein
LWNSITNPDGYSNCDPYSDGDRDGHTNSYTKTHSNPEIPPLTKAPSDSTAPSITGKHKARCSHAPVGRFPDSAQRRIYSAGRFMDRLLVAENRFQRNLWIEMIGSQPVAIEQR